MREIIEKCLSAKNSALIIANASSVVKDKALKIAADNLRRYSGDILKSNAEDLERSVKNGLKGSILDRLTLTEERISDMATGLEKIISLEDPIGEIIQMWKRPNGLRIGQKRVPLGVVGIIYEARPNVTVDVFGLCIKTGNASVLRGGKEAILSNKAIIKVLKTSLSQAGLPEDSIQLIDDITREGAITMMKLNDYLDVLIPRGGAGLIKTVMENSTIPVIETGTGNCHVYVDSKADKEKAISITFNAKTQRPGVCNAAESLLIHKDVAHDLLPFICSKLQEKNVEIRGDQAVCKIINYAIPANDEDWGKEYLDYVISVKVVGSVKEAIDHINKYGTKHSEAIITEDYSNAQRFLDEVDAAAVYVNASTRFTDGYEFGFGAEVGISTQKLHARGPMGLKALTSIKYIIYGDGQIR